MDRERKKQLTTSYLEKKKIGGVLGVRNKLTGKTLLISTTDIDGYMNRFSFSLSTNSPIHVKLTSDWMKYGSEQFVCEILESIEKKKDQTDREFTDDIAELLNMQKEKMDPALLY